MKREKQGKRKPSPANVKVQARAGQPWWQRGWTAPALLGVAVLVFYWTPLTDPQTTPQWDTIDYHLSVQKYFADEIRSWRLPLWTEHAYAGYPFLADPQVGAWYPLNWPFFLVGVTPKSLQLEIALHALLACLGAYWLAWRWVGRRDGAAVAALAFGLSGYFAGHSSHLGMFQSAAWLPWLLVGAERSISEEGWRNRVLTGIGAAAMFLAGHFQSALYCLSIFALYGLAYGVWQRRLARALLTLGAVAVLMALLTAIQWLPTMELVANSTRAARSFAQQTNAPLEARALWTLVHPNYYGSVSGEYTGPEDRTQFYFYGGFLLIPLALMGLAHSGRRWLGLVLIVPAAWYALGPAGGLYRLVALLPGFAHVRAPVHIWFVVALGLALLAGAGCVWMSARLRRSWTGAVLGLILFADLFYWNSLENQLAYARTSYEMQYGRPLRTFAAALARLVPAETRFHSPFASPAFGPLNGAFDIRARVTYGSNPLPLARYMAYFESANSNIKLLDGLLVGARVTDETGAVARNESMLPRFYFARNVLPAASAAASAALLGKLDPHEMTVVEAEVPAGMADPGARLSVFSQQDGHYELEYEATAPAVLRAAIPYYPGWRATVDGKAITLAPADHALIAMVVPAGKHKLTLRYQPSFFGWGVILSAVSAAGVGFVLWRGRLASSGAGSSAGSSSATI